MRELTTHVIGASNSLFARSPTAEIVQDETRFVMTRLGEGATCADVLAVDSD